MNATTPNENTNKVTSNFDSSNYTEQPKLAEFWTVVKGKGTPKAQPSWTCIRDKLIEMGFRTYWPAGMYKGTPEFIHLQGNILHPIEAYGIKNMFVSSYIDTMEGIMKIELEDSDPVTFESNELKESFLRVFGNNFAVGQLHSLPPFMGKILRDTRTSAFFLFNNVIVEAQAGRLRELNYSDLGDRYVWSTQVIKRDFVAPQQPLKISEFERFLINISNNIPARMAAFVSAIGYQLHNFIKQSEAKVIWITDEAITDKDSPQGRNGKGIIEKGVAELRNVHYRDGKAYHPTNGFFWQGITHSTQVVWIDDPNELFDFEKLFSVAVEGWVVPRKHREDLTLSLEESPKIYIASNQPPKLRGSSYYGRLHVLTASSFYSDRLNEGTGRPIVDFHGCEFFTEWDENEWSLFYSFMLKCVCIYLKDGLKSYHCPSLIKNQLIRQTSQEFTDWTVDTCLSDGGILDDGTERTSADLLENYKSVSGDEKLTTRTFNRWLKIYADLNKLKIIDRKSSGKKYMFFKKC